jgi:catechol 2,3-dioxygenase-like lactoylglutathione lyase family enzyme
LRPDPLSGTRKHAPPDEGASHAQDQAFGHRLHGPQKLAKFYCEVFDMKVVQRNGRQNVFISDGYITVALLSQKAEGKPCGLNHFGFHVEDSDVIAGRMKNWKVVGPEQRPADRAYAELRATDPEGNNFDLAEGGFERGAPGGSLEGAPVTA